MKRPARARQPAASLPATSLERIWVIALIACLVTVAGLAYFSDQRLADFAARARQQHNVSLAKLYATQLQEMVRYYHASLATMARDPALAAAFQAADGAALAARTAQLQSQIPQALRVDLLPLDTDQPDRERRPPLSYACLALVQRAAAGQPSAAEVHQHGKEHQHVDFAHAVTGAGRQPVGVLLLSLRTDAVLQAFRRLPVAGGFAELVQTTPQGNEVVLAQQGAAGLRVGAAEQDAEVPGTSWRIRYWGALSSPGAAERGLSVWLVFGGAFAFIVLLMVLLYLQLSGLYRKDQVTVVRLFRDLRDGTLAREYPVLLRNSRGLVNQLLHMARDMKPYVQVPAQDQAEPEAEEELVDLTNYDDDALEVRDLGDEARQRKKVPPSIFRAYDIRGVVGEVLSERVVRLIGQAIGSEASERGLQSIVVGRDGRLSGPELSAALIDGLRAAGCDVTDLGQVPTPVLYFATHYVGGGSGVMLTGSHNPPQYNGMKIMLGGETLHGDAIQALRARIENGRLSNGEGKLEQLDVIPSYIDRIASDVRLERPLKVAVDCGNGVAGAVAPQLFRMLGCELIELYCEVDGNFPNHHPDPSKPENLVALTRAVAEHGADVGLAFDGDGDRLGVVDAEGKIIWPDRILMLLAADVLSRQPGGQIIYDVKCSRNLAQVINEHGGEALMWKTGHSFIKAKMLETGAQLAGEMSGHIFFKERWFGFDDALYAGARLLEVLSGDERPSGAVFSALPESVSTPELNIHLQEGEHFKLMERLLSAARFGGAKLITIDGLRVEFEDGWGLIRASNTTPSLVLRFEADDAAALRRIQDEFRQQLLSIDGQLQLPF